MRTHHRKYDRMEKYLSTTHSQRAEKLSVTSLCGLFLVSNILQPARFTSSLEYIGPVSSLHSELVRLVFG